PAARRTTPSSATPRPSEVRIRYFQAASSACALPLKPTSSAEAAVVASTRSHAPPRLAASGTARRIDQNPKSTAKYVPARRFSATSDDVAPSRYVGETSTLASPTIPTTPTSSPPAASTTIQLPVNGESAPCSA